MAQFLSMTKENKHNIHHLIITTMKKAFAIMATLFIALTACANHEHAIAYSELPAQAQSFIQHHFNVADIAYIEKERDGLLFEFTVYLKNATKIDFDQSGNLESIDCEIYPIPEGIIPEVIANYLKQHYSNHFAVKYSINRHTIEIELGNGLELLFDLEGKFLRIDD